jgi:chemotaxis regulatin CheY-phosphate phosphatase CheZ
MNQDPTSILDRLLALAAEAEKTLAQTVASEEVRDAFAIVRGHLDLGRLYGEPINVDELERVLARIANSIGDAKFRRRFLMRLRTVAAWERLAPVTTSRPMASASASAADRALQEIMGNPLNPGVGTVGSRAV